MQPGPERMFRPLFRGNLARMGDPKDDFLPDDDGSSDAAWDDWPGEEIEPDEEDLAAIAEIEAGQFISNEAVMRWLDDFSKGIRRPPPQPGE
jgi:hypothetical protein